MALEIQRYGLQRNESGTRTYVTGPDSKIIADTGLARICVSAEQADAVTQGNIDTARRIAACLNACDGMSIEKLEAIPASFNMLLSDGFKRAIEQPAIVAMITEEQTRDFIEKWNALPQTGGQIVPMPRGDLMPPIEVEQIAWLQKAHTLHRQVSMLYVVDGYEVTVEWDENPISEAFHGETLREAISKAMAGHDLNVYNPYKGEKRYPEDSQRGLLLRTLKEVRAHIEKISSDHWWIDTPDRGGFDTDKLDAVLAEFEGGDV